MVGERRSEGKSLSFYCPKSCTVYSVHCTLYTVQAKEGLGQCNNSLVCEAPCPVSSREVPVSHYRRSQATTATTVPLSHCPTVLGHYSHYSPSLPLQEIAGHYSHYCPSVPLSQATTGLYCPECWCRCQATTPVRQTIVG